MPGLFRFAVVIAFGTYCAGLAGEARGEDLIPVGAAKIDVGPEGPIRLHGYLARKTPSVGIDQPIFAKALAIGSKPADIAVLITLDGLGFTDALATEVAGRIENKAGVGRAHIAFSASHTHYAPCIAGLAPNIFGMKIAAHEQAAIDAYTRKLADQLESVALEAIRNRRPSRLSWGQGSVGFAANRRTQGGPVDHSVPVLEVESPEGRLRAVVAGYACHCTTIDPAINKISGDWSGFAQAEVEQAHPGAVAMVVIGCGADSNPSPRQHPEDAKNHGHALAAEIERVLAGKLVPLASAPECKLSRIDLPLGPMPSRSDLEKLVKAGGPPGYNAQTHIDKLDQGMPLQSSINYVIQSWSFGDKLAIVFLSGEVVVDYALRIKKEFDRERLWTVAYANDDPGYIPSERILTEGGYEGGGAMVYYAKPAPFEHGLENKILKVVHDLVPRSFATGKPQGALEPGPLDAKRALASIQAPEGLVVELAAAEPLVFDPVAIDFGADGKLWVADMRDYPMGADGKYAPGGEIRILTDADGDGAYDRATVFLDKVPFPTGVMAWGKGALICAAPEIVYAEDRDGDGKADFRKVLYSGFATENYQARVNGLEYGLDNWVYGANGLIGGRIKAAADGTSFDLGARDFRIMPDQGLIEPVSGLSQQGRVRDDWGNMFGNNNSILLQHYTFPEHAASANPYVPIPLPIVNVSQNPDWNLLHPISAPAERFNDPLSLNRVTSACGPGFYRDDRLGSEYQGNAFVCEPVHNLVRRLVLKPAGASFRAEAPETERNREFLASTDPFFRPVQAKTGPDGALYIVDMYRGVIEHPRWISAEKLARLDIRAGQGQGRIYRVVRPGKALRKISDLTRFSARDLAAALETPNGIVRDQAQRLLVERGDARVRDDLARLVRQSRIPECRAQALGTLAGLGSLDEATLIAGLRDPHAGVRLVAATAAEDQARHNAATATELIRLLDDSDAKVVVAAAIALGSAPDARAGKALAELSKRAEDPWVRAAIIAAAPARLETLVTAACTDQFDTHGYLEPLIATAIGVGDRGLLSRALAGLIKHPRAQEPRVIKAIAAILEARPADDAKETAEYLDRIRKLVRDREAQLERRIAAVSLFGLVASDRDRDRAELAGLLNPEVPAQLQSAAITALFRLGAVDAVYSAWSRLDSEGRRTAIELALTRPERAERLVERIEKGALGRNSLDAASQSRLLAIVPKRVKARVQKLLAPAGARAEVVATYRRELENKRGDAKRGEQVFQKACSACHRLNGSGHEVGPDLAALTDRSLESYLTAILDPNREVDARYSSYSAQLKDGRIVTGMIAGEAGATVLFKQQEAKVQAVLRSEIDELKGGGQSLMPEGLERDIGPSEMADLVAFLAGSGRTLAPKVFPGNTPVVVAADRDGAVRLAAETAEIRGDSLIYEPELNNLGYWHSANDEATWRFATDRAGVFTISLEWACALESAGNTYQMELDGKTLKGKVGATGEDTWANYRSIFAGEVSLDRGAHRLRIVAGGPIRGALMDLRAVALKPRIALQAD